MTGVVRLLLNCRLAEEADLRVLVATIAAMAAATNNRHLSRLFVTFNNFEDGYVSTGLTALFWRSRIECIQSSSALTSLSRSSRDTASGFSACADE